MVRQRIFEPLQMADSGFACEVPIRPDQASAAGDFAVGYVDAGGKPAAPYFRGWMRHLSVADFYRSCGPDQTIISNLSDMCSWIGTHLSANRHGRQPLCPAEVLAPLYVPQVAAPGIWQSPPEQADTCCGLGWFVQTYCGRRHIFHGGTGCGCTSLVSFLPEEAMGVVVLCNQASHCGIQFAWTCTITCWDWSRSAGSAVPGVICRGRPLPVSPKHLVWPKVSVTVRLPAHWENTWGRIATPPMGG